MKRVISLSLVLLVALLPIEVSMAATQVKAGAVCTKNGQVKSVNYVVLKCTKIGKKLVWKVTSVGSGLDRTTPSVSPNFSLVQIGDSIEAKVLIPLLNSLKNSRIDEVVATIYVKQNSMLYRIGESKQDLRTWSDSVSYLNFKWDLKGQYSNRDISVDAQFGNQFGRSGSNIKTLTVSETRASPSPTPSASPSPSKSVSETVNQMNAKKSALSYLNFSSFSRIGLIKQLEYEGYSRSDSEYAVDAQNANWANQAKKTAANYLKFSSFSYSGLYDQLIYEGFTAEQAKTGVDSTGLTSSVGSTPLAAPSISPTPVAASDGVCKVSYVNALPFSSQRIAATEMLWEKDSQGYLSVNLKLRNDNSMALRLVEFTFSFFNKSSLVVTTSTLDGNHHFYIQDDAKFNSADNLKGPWLSGQTRTFKIATNQIMDCNSITVMSSGFTVKQGIGAS